MLNIPVIPCKPLYLRQSITIVNIHVDCKLYLSGARFSVYRHGYEFPVIDRN